MKYEILKNGIVDNYIIASHEYMQEHYTDGSYRLVEELLIPDTEDKWKWLIDIGPFFDRFGNTKMLVLSSTDPSVKALISDLQVRKWVDLKLPEVLAGLQLISTIIPEVSTSLITSIIETPVADKENLALRKLYFT